MALKIAVCYAVVGGLWILFSGWVLHHEVHDPELAALVERIKGWGFVAVTALLLGLALNRYFREIRQAAELLQSSEQRWQSVLKGAGHGVWDWNVQTNEVFQSAGWKSMLGFEPHEIGDRLQDWEQRVHPEDLPRVQAEFQSHLAGQTPNYTSEHRLRCKDGSYRWVLDQGRVMSRTADGKPLRVMGTHSDITARRQAQKEHETALIKYRTLFDLFPLGITVADKHGMVVEANHVAGKLLGISTGEQVKSRMDDAEWRTIRPDGTPMPVEEYASTRALKENRLVENVEMGLVTTSNGTIWLNVTAVPFALEEYSVVVAYADITERKRAQESFTMEFNRRRILFEEATDGIVVMDKNLRVVEANRSFALMLGYAAVEEIMPLYPWDWDAIYTTRESLLAAWPEMPSGPQTFDTKFRRKDGKVIEVEITSNPTEWAGQRILFNICRDITQRSHAEDALRESEERFRKVVETAPEAIFIRIKDCFAYVNLAALRLFGAAYPEELVNKSVMDRFHPEYREAIRERMRIVDHERRSVVTVDQVFLRLDGSSVPVVVSAAPFTYQNQSAALVFARDITGLKRTEALLQESLLFRRQAEKIARVGAWKVNPQTDYLYWTEGVNEILEAPLDYKPSFEEGMKFYDEKSAPVLREALRQALAFGTPFVVEVGLTTMTGKHLWAEVRGLGRLDEDDQAFVMGTIHDITERKRLETQIRQGQKLEAIGRLAGGVAHDFNNILAAIMIHLGLLQMNPRIEPATRKALAEIVGHAQRAADLTRQLLMFGRRSVLAMKPLDLNGVVANLLKMLKRLISENINVRFEASSAIPLVEGDDGMMEQVLMNLVVNARDAMPNGGTMTIGTTLAELGAANALENPNRLPGRFVCLAVSDTGCGMDAGTLKQIFEPFFTTKEAGKGTGLGLATVHGIVAQHRGWVEVDSKVGVGTTFRVYLPATDQAHVEAGPVPPTELLRGGGETILLVEDEVHLREVVGESLRALGYQVHEAKSGQEAITFWQLHGAGVDLLITDMVMPDGMTGLELTEYLQALRPGLNSIISSGYSSEIVGAGVPTRAGIAYLPKPYATRVLASLIRDCLDRKPSPEARA